MTSLVSGTPGRADAVDLEVWSDHRLFVETLPLDILQSFFRVDEDPGAENDLEALLAPSDETADTVAFQSHLLASLRYRPTDWFGLRLGIDTGLIQIDENGASIDGQPFGERAEATLFLGETYAEAQLGGSGEVLIRAGKLRPRIGDGAVFDAYGFGIEIDVDLTLSEDPSPWRFRAQAILPDGTFTDTAKKSPLVNLEAAYRFGPGRELRLLGIIFHDGDDGLERLLSEALVRSTVPALLATLNRLPNRTVFSTFLEEATLGLASGTFGYDFLGQGTLGWVGPSFAWRFDRLIFEVTGLVGLGGAEVSIRPDRAFDEFIEVNLSPFPRTREAVRDSQIRQGRIEFLSGFMKAEARLQLSDAWRVSSFFVAATGDDALEPTGGGAVRYSAFVSIAPLLPYTNIFFNGGVAQSLASPTVSSISPDAAGLVGGGVHVRWSTARFDLETIGGVFGAARDIGVSGRLFGGEVDVRSAYWLHPQVRLQGDLAVFFPGSFFGPQATGVQGILGVTVLYP